MFFGGLNICEDGLATGKGHHDPSMMTCEYLLCSQDKLVVVSFWYYVSQLISRLVACAHATHIHIVSQHTKHTYVVWLCLSIRSLPKLDMNQWLYFVQVSHV